MNDMKVIKAEGLQLLSEVRGLSPGIINTRSSLYNTRTTTSSCKLKFNTIFQHNCLFNPKQQQANVDFESQRLRPEIVIISKASRPGYGVHPASFTVATDVCFRTKCCRYVDHSPPSYEGVKNEWS